MDSNGELNSAELDHVKAKSRKGADDVSNYQLLCRECNGKKGAKLADVFEYHRERELSPGMLVIRK